VVLLGGVSFLSVPLQLLLGPPPEAMFWMKLIPIYVMQGNVRYWY
jgi:hypothetical protein